MDYESFESSIGLIRVSSNSYCKGCERFYPTVSLCCKTDKDGKVIWTPDGQTLRDGVRIYCEHMYECQSIAHEVSERIRKEVENGRT